MGASQVGRLENRLIMFDSAILKLRDALDSKAGNAYIEIRSNPHLIYAYGPDKLLAIAPLAKPCGYLSSDGDLILQFAASPPPAVASGQAFYGKVCDGDGAVQVELPVTLGAWSPDPIVGWIAMPDLAVIWGAAPVVASAVIPAEEDDRVACDACYNNMLSYLQSKAAIQEELRGLRDDQGYWESKLASATSEIARLEPLIAAAEEEAQPLDTAFREARVEYNVTMNNNRDLLDKCSPAKYMEQILAINTAMRALAEYQSGIELLRAKVALIMAQIMNAESEIMYLVGINLSEGQQSLEVWCADLTEDGSGSVATLEVPGEPAQIILAPGTRAPAAGDGQVMMREVMTKEQVAFNLAVLPGWQKWKPTYRVGTLTDKDDDMNMGTVAFDVARSTATGIPRATRENKAWPYGGDAAGLPINQEDPGWIEFEYMNCDSLAFDVGDRVLVEFRGQDWASPMIIGFESHPKYCYTWGPRGYFIQEINSNPYDPPPYTKTYYMWSITLAGPFVWGYEQWTAEYGGFLCPGCWKSGTITHSDDYIEVKRSGSTVLVHVRANRGVVSFSVENPTSVPEIKQFEAGTECDSTITSCPYYQEPSYTYAATYTLPVGFNPVGSEHVDAVVALFGIPGTNFFDPGHEKGLAVLSGITASTPAPGVGWLFARYEPPEDDYVPPDP